MAIVVLLAGSETAELAVGPGSARALADLGITRLTVLRDAGSTAVVLEGWAFDPVHGERAAGLLFPSAASPVRTLRQVADVGLTDSRRP